MLKVEVKIGEREQTAWSLQCKLLEQLHAAAVRAAEDPSKIPPLVLPPQPALRVPLFLLVEPPYDLMQLPVKAREAMLGAVVSLGNKRGREVVTGAAANISAEIATEIALACVVGDERVIDGEAVQRRYRLVNSDKAGSGTFPIAAIDLAERMAVKEAVDAHLATFRSLLFS